MQLKDAAPNFHCANPRGSLQAGLVGALFQAVFCLEWLNSPMGKPIGKLRAGEPTVTFWFSTMAEVPPFMARPLLILAAGEMNYSLST